MPTLTHSEANSLTFDDSTPAKTVTGWAAGANAIDAGANAFYLYINLQVSVAFGGSADGDAIIKLRTSSDSSTTDDTLNLDFITVPVNAGSTDIISFKVEHFNFLELGVYNGNSAVEDITISAKWEGCKVTDDT